ANCFHGCLSGPANRHRRDDLRRRILGGAVVSASCYRTPPPPRNPSVLPTGVDGPLPRVTFPGQVVPLNELPPDHHARRYLLTRPRPFDPDELATQYYVGYCVRSEVHPAEGRIIIPVMMNGVMVGWQGRWP